MQQPDTLLKTIKTLSTVILGLELCTLPASVWATTDCQPVKPVCAFAADCQTAVARGCGEEAAASATPIAMDESAAPAIAKPLENNSAPPVPVSAWKQPAPDPQAAASLTAPPAPNGIVNWFDQLSRKVNPPPAPQAIIPGQARVETLDTIPAIIAASPPEPVPVSVPAPPVAVSAPAPVETAAVAMPPETLVSEPPQKSVFAEPAPKTKKTKGEINAQAKPLAQEKTPMAVVEPVLPVVEPVLPVETLPPAPTAATVSVEPESAAIIKPQPGEPSAFAIAATTSPQSGCTGGGSVHLPFGCKSIQYPQTGLAWTRPSAGEMSWRQAVAYCQGLETDGFTDWRLPELKEIQSLFSFANDGVTPTNYPHWLPNHVVLWYNRMQPWGYVWLFRDESGFMKPYYQGSSYSIFTRQQAFCVRSL